VPDERSSQIEQRVLVLAPTAKDAAICRNLLGEAGVFAAICPDLSSVCREMARGAAAAVIAEEAIDPNSVGELVAALHQQPAWSDFPLLILVQEGDPSPIVLQMLETLGNVSLLERPVRVPTLVSVLKTAQRARNRQYQIRDLLIQAGETAEQLRQEARGKDEFLAMLAHELRNPLAPIRNGVEILKLELANHASRSVLPMMERQVNHMVRLVDDLLDVSRILRGKITLHKETLDLGTILGQAIETAHPLIAEQGHQLIVSYGPGAMHLEGDSVRLTQVFANILNNAAKYTEPGGQITVETARLREDRFLVSIRDTGIGIAPDMLPRVFDLFSQAERSLDRSQGGLGLGLTLVKRLIEMHGGVVRVLSEGLGQGTEFQVELPAAAAGAARQAVAQSSEASAAPKSLRILVVDDNRDAANSLASLLAARAHHVSAKYDGESSVEEASRFQPDVVLLDIGLPGMSGYEVAKRLRHGKEGPILIAITGYGQIEDRRLSSEAGFDFHLVKPIELSELERLLDGEILLRNSR
jgi:signal transduction histidine kinase/CheY-like chemotaxis protein